jgi:putative transposase
MKSDRRCGWSMDFLSDTLVSNEKKVRVLNVLDECSRMVLLSFAAKSISAKKLATAAAVNLLDELVKEKGKPSYVRCDNGLEFISKELAKFTHDNGIKIRFSQGQRPTVRKTHSKWIGRTIKWYA